MSLELIPAPFITEEEYMRRERDAKIKSEYFQGRIYAMAGGTLEHSQIAGNAITELNLKLRGQPCRTLTSDMRIRVNETGLQTYPDVTVVCGEPVFAFDNRYVIVNPTLIVEVLSPSTANYDRTTKFDHFKAIPTFTDYLLIYADRVRVEHYSRNHENIWIHSVAAQRDAELAIHNLGITLSVAELYRNLSLPELNLLHDALEAFLLEAEKPI